MVSIRKVYLDPGAGYFCRLETPYGARHTAYCGSAEEARANAADLAELIRLEAADRAAVALATYSALCCG